MRLGDENFATRYGDAEKWMHEGCTGKWTDIRWRWSDDCVRRSKDWAKACNRNIDFQVYPARHWDAAYRDTARLRLDTRRGRV